jgi:hypothetical protein
MFRSGFKRNYSGGGFFSESKSFGSISALEFSGVLSDPEAATAGKTSLNARP